MSRLGASSELAVCLAEVQGRGGNEDFPLRMHRYRGLLEGRYRRPVIALALLIEPLSKAQSSGVYRWEGYGTRVSYEFPVFRIYTNAPSFVSLTRRSRSHWAPLRRKRPAQHPKAVPSDKQRTNKCNELSESLRGLIRAGCLLKAGLSKRDAGFFGQAGLKPCGQAELFSVSLLASTTRQLCRVST